MKKIISLLLAILLVGSTCLITAEPIHASTADWQFTGATCTTNSAAASTINYIRAKYDQYSTYTGSGQCFGWAEKVGNMLAAERSTKYYKNYKFTKKSFLNKCNGIKAGAHLRLSHNKEYNGASGHSICLLKVSKKKNLVCWTDNNYAGYETIAYYSGTIDQFVSYYSQYEYFNALTKTTKYKAQSEPLMAIEKAADGRSKLYWTKTTSTSKYKVYRSTSKNGKYKLIKTTTAKSYKDTTAKYGVKYYYKVRSVKSGTDLYSNKVYSTARLNKPAMPEIDNNLENSGLKISWKKVTNADKYSIYRAKVGSSKYTYIATTKKTTYTDKKANLPGKTYSYKIRAIYSKNTKGNSYLSDASYWINPRPATPKVAYEFDEENRTLTLSWKKVPYAQGYIIGSYENQNYNSYRQVAYIQDLSYTINLKNYYYAGNTYEFWVQTIPNTGTSSMQSKFVTIEIPDDWTTNDYGYWY